MEKKNKALIIAFIIFLALIVVDINSLNKGIEEHQTWRIVLASTSGLLFIAFAILVGNTMLKNRKRVI
jgi:hypothetical protein